MSTIILHCFYSGKDGAARAFMEEMLSSGLRQAVLDEDGCLQYDYALSVQDGETGILLEKWRDAEALQKHMDGAAMRGIRAVKERYALETKLEKYYLKD